MGGAVRAAQEGQDKAGGQAAPVHPHEAPHCSAEHAPGPPPAIDDAPKKAPTSPRVAVCCVCIRSDEAIEVRSGGSEVPGCTGLPSKPLIAEPRRGLACARHKVDM